MTTNDTRLAALLSECLGELMTRGDEARPRALELLGQVEAISPGLLEQMVGGLQLARLPRTSAH